MKYIVTSIFLFCIAIAFTAFPASAQQRRATVDVQLDTRLEVGGISEFDRRKFVTMHSSLQESDWVGKEDKLRHLVEDLDVYFGRDTGRITWALSQLKEDQKQNCFIDFRFMEYYAKKAQEDYAKRVDLKGYADRDDLIVCAQLHPFWPDGSTIKPADGSAPWSLANAFASGQYMAYWVNMFTGGKDPTRPRLLEIVNEPLFELEKEKGKATPREVFEYHRDAAKAIRQFNSDVLIGGYTAAFPDVERDDFREWRERWKDFIDITGDDVNFYSLHLYDFPGIDGGKQFFRKGAHLEATLDMIEHYSAIKHGKPKPFVVSEYGSQLHDWYNQPWSPYRDWLCLKATNSILLQLMSRPDRVLKAVPFITAKAEWGMNEGDSGHPYYWRLLRRKNEPNAFTGEYVFTEQIKLYELWSNVRGTRVPIKSTDKNLLVDAYVNGNDCFVIINNLRATPVALDIRQHGTTQNNIRAAYGKHLYLYENKPRLDVVDLLATNKPLVLGAEATMILHFAREAPTKFKRAQQGANYYASEHSKAIEANKPLRYAIKVGPKQKAMSARLRLGMGRPKGKSLASQVHFNGTRLEVPVGLRGPLQSDRETRFGVREITVPPQTVPPQLVRAENIVAIDFHDDGGRVSSIVLNCKREVPLQGK